MLDLNRTEYIPGSESSSCQFLRIDPDPDFTFLKTSHLHISHTIDRLELFLEHLVGIVGEHAIVNVSRDRDPHEGLGVQVELVDHGFLGIIGEIAFGKVDLGAHLLSRDIAVFFQFELNDDLRIALITVGDDVLDAADGLDLLLEHIGHIGIDYLRAGPFEDGRDRYHRDVHLGEQVDTHAHKGDEPENDNSCRDGERGDRSSDGKICYLHITLPSDWYWCVRAYP